MAKEQSYTSTCTIAPLLPAISAHALPIVTSTPSRRTRSISRTSICSATRLGMLFMAPGKTSHTPTVPTVSIIPVAFAAASQRPERFPPRLKTHHDDQASTRRRHGRRILRSKLARAGAAMALTIPKGIFWRSSNGPCSICSSTKA